MKRISIIIIAVCGLLAAVWATDYNIPLTDGRMEVTAGRIRMVEGWVPGYTKRIKLTVDNTKIDADLTNFPVTIFLTPTQGEELFSELDADADYMKVAFAASDGTNQLYAEKELFDVSESNAIYHVSKAGWTISNSGDTDFYMYYYNDASDNTNYIGAINTTAGATVWDSNFKAVHHMADETTSNILDSTSNDNDGTKEAANDPVEAASKIGLGQDFDGEEEYITLSAKIPIGAKTLEVLCYPTDAPHAQTLDVLLGEANVSSDSYGNSFGWNHSAHGFVYRLYQNIPSTYILYFSSSTEKTPSNWVYSVFSWDGTTGADKAIIYVDGSADGTSTASSIEETVPSNNTRIGKDYYSSDRTFEGIIDEVRISDSVRSAAWIKATYNSLWDSLVSYGDEER